MFDLSRTEINESRLQFLVRVKNRNPVDAYHQYGDLGLMLARTGGVHPLKVLINAAADIYGVDPEAIIGKKRTPSVVLPRHYVMYHARHDLRMTYPDIGRRIGRRDHSTAIHGYLKHALRHRLPASIPGRISDEDLSVPYEGPEPTISAPWKPRCRTPEELAAARLSSREFWSSRLRAAGVPRGKYAPSTALKFKPE